VLRFWVHCLRDGSNSLTKFFLSNSVVKQRSIHGPSAIRIPPPRIGSLQDLLYFTRFSQWVICGSLDNFLVISWVIRRRNYQILSEAPSMRRDYDVFEKFPDGSTLWRACVAGRYGAQRKIHELAERSDNEFFLIDIQPGQHLPFSLPRANTKPHQIHPRDLLNETKLQFLKR
jgi:hypothetical protein